MDILIRKETAVDQESVRLLIIRAFETAEFSDKDEHNLVNRLRLSPHFDPDLSLVAEVNKQIVGHILFTRVQIRQKINQTIQSWALAPVSVAPDFQGRGIGGALIKEGHDVLRRKGHTSVILLGHSSYYPRFGYRPASQWGLKAPFEVPDENFMAIELVNGALHNSAGTVEYPAEFGITASID